MERILSIVFRMVKVLGAVAGVSLTIMMCLTVADVVGRAVGHPILGTYEIIGLLGVIVIGFAVPYTSWNKRHVYMDFLVQRIPQRKKDILNIVTRVLGIVLFIFIGVNMFHIGAEFSKAREVSMSLNIPLYPVAYAAGICCFVECVVFMCDIVKIREGKYE
jgi:TRAP-type C4-dicarboxylate transport system permease small subunit